MHTTLTSRHAISRAEFFLDKAEQCTADQTLEFESFMEAAIVFAKAAVHRARKRKGGGSWLKGLAGNAAAEFFDEHRNYVLKEGPPKVGQVVRLGVSERRAADMYYFENPSVPATQTLRKFLADIRALIGAEAA